LTAVKTPFFVFLFLAVCPVSFPKDEPPTRRAGKYEVTLRLPPDGLFAEEEMEIEFRVVDTSQVDPVLGPAPIVRARIDSVIDMPSMPGMPKVEEIAHPEGVPGEYGVHPTFAHGGEFRMRLAVNPPAGEPFAVEFPLQVQDASQARRRKPKARPYSVDLNSKPGRPRAGEPAALELRLRHRDRPREIVNNFEVVHEKLLHLLIVRDDLGFFGHEHPDIGPDGVFRINYTFPSAGNYHLFVDVAPRGAGSHVLLARLRVGGKSASRYDLARAAAARAVVKRVEGTQVELAAGGSLPIRKTTSLTFHLKDAATGRSVTDIQPYLGAMGHLILIHQDGVTFVHSHPDERIDGVGRDGQVPFLVRFPKPGLYRGWSQFQRNGAVLTTDFILEASEGAGQ
jgi:hypothetical protein